MRNKCITRTINSFNSRIKYIFRLLLLWLFAVVVVLLLTCLLVPTGFIFSVTIAYRIIKTILLGAP